MKCKVTGITEDACRYYNSGGCYATIGCRRPYEVLIMDDIKDVLSTVEPNIFAEIRAERQRADAKYGEERNLLVHQWASLIRTELEEALTGYFKGIEPPHDYRTEMVQVASLVVAAIENYDRQREG